MSATQKKGLDYLVRRGSNAARQFATVLVVRLRES